MSKAVLAMDMPESCYQCPFGNDNFENIRGIENFKMFFSKEPDVKFIKFKPD